MVDFPGARVRNAQDLWRFMGERDAERRDRVARRMDPAVLDQIENAVKTAWIPIEDDAKFVDAILDIYGVADSMELWRTYTRRFTETGLMKAFIDGTVRIFGLSLASLARVVPRAWQQSYRGCGEGGVPGPGDSKSQT